VDIVVLVKQVPDTESIIQIGEDGVSINTDDIKWVMNPYDELAVEAALQIKESQGGTITILSMGPDKTVETIRTALAMGADKGIHITDPSAEGSDALSRAKLLAEAIKTIPFDLVIAGMRAVDEDNYLVGSAVAEFLDIPQISQATKVAVEDQTITCHRVIEGGTLVTKTPLPVLFTTQRGLNEPRYASLPGIMKAKRKPIDTLGLSDLGISPDTVGQAGRKIKISALNFPSDREPVKMIDGENASDIASNLVKILHEEVKVI
jgi:electron transfer flavoprotein beta subunit